MLLLGGELDASALKFKLGERCRQLSGVFIAILLGMMGFTVYIKED